ncbi:MAG TPA: molecular chaperone DnaJ [Planctomycetaceae bacterium]|nr:molecular chaperone DnaJ [Planctomycetaceae bacterium]
MMATKRDYYEVLGVAREASADDLKKAYRKLAAKHHPDRNPGDQAAIESFKEAAEAFEVLSHDEKRARYDRFGHAGVQGGAGAGGAQFHDVQDIFDAFGGIFGDLFGNQGGGRRGRGGSRARRGEHLRTAVTIDLAEAATGCSRELEIQRKIVCKTCSGTGAKPGTTPVGCDYCGGHGQVVQSQGFFRVQTVCPACQGSGKIVREKCADCRGTKYQPLRVKLDVKIPAGVDNEMQIRVAGEGEPGENGGPPGDLYVDLRVKSHPNFQRNGRHLMSEIPITFTQAALGTELDIPLLTGTHKLTVPPGTQPGDVFRLKGQGMPDPHGGPRGDLVTRVQVAVPKKLTKKYEELLRKLAEIEEQPVLPHQKSFFESVKEFFTGDEDE